jgi:hypothetical protein
LASKYEDHNFAQYFQGSKEEFKAAYKQHMTEKYGSFWVSIMWFFIQLAISRLWKQYHAD